MGAILSSLAPAIGGVAGGAASYFGQTETNSSNASQISQQEQFQTAMSGTAHQREVADLRAAGLNPLLSANAGASTPMGANVQLPSPTAAAVSGAESGAGTALQVANGVKDLAVKDSQEKLNQANASVASKTAGVKGFQSDLSSAADKVLNFSLSGYQKLFHAMGLDASSAKDVRPVGSSWSRSEPTPNLFFGATPGGR